MEGCAGNGQYGILTHRMHSSSGKGGAPKSGVVHGVPESEAVHVVNGVSGEGAAERAFGEDAIDGTGEGGTRVRCTPNNLPS